MKTYKMIDPATGKELDVAIEEVEPTNVFTITSDDGTNPTISIEVEVITPSPGVRRKWSKQHRTHLSRLRALMTKYENPGPDVDPDMQSEENVNVTSQGLIEEVKTAIRATGPDAQAKHLGSKWDSDFWTNANWEVLKQIRARFRQRCSA